MGLFDNVYSSYKPLGEEFLNVELQTKSLDCDMSAYWITPAGELFKVNWDNAMKMVDREVPIKPVRWVPPFQWVPTGKHKKLTPVYYTGALVVYPVGHSGPQPTGSWLEATLLLKHGKVIYHETKQRNKQ